ncbi:MAG TPA: hypothetical protein VHV30_03970 [Polyangiaceae bacterium]|nr:hypothetical protein [Polyangiaceae bacterium]
MSQEPQPLTALIGAASADAPDPELEALPAPPRRARTFTVVALGLGAVAALLVAFGLRHEAAYALTSETPVNLGDLRSASDMSLAESENRPVRGEAMLGAAGGIRYERPFGEGSFRALPVVGRANPLDMWVEVRVPAGEENGRWEPPRSFSGRLVRLDASGPRHRGLPDAIEQATQAHVPSGAWLVVDGEEPADARWSILLGGMFLGFAAWNGVVIARILRRVRA